MGFLFLFKYFDMKFAKYLTTESVPEWRKKYINYKLLKKLLKQIKPPKHDSTEDLASPIVSTRNYADSVISRDGDGESVVDTDHLDSIPLVSLPPAKLPLSPTLSSYRPESPIQRTMVAGSTNAANLSRSSTQSPQLTRGVYGSPTANSINNFLRRISTPTRSKSLLATRPSNAPESFEALLLTKSPEEQLFFRFLKQELDKIDTFYSEKESEAVQQLAKLKSQLKILDAEQKRKLNLRKKIIRDRVDDEGEDDREYLSTWAHVSETFKKILVSMGDGEAFDVQDSKDSNDPLDSNAAQYMKIGKNAKAKLEHAVSEYYRSLELVKNYKILNYTGFVKILKKFDKTAGWKSSDFYIPKVDGRSFQQSKTIDALLNDTEELFIKHFSKGRRQDGMRKLRLPDLRHQTHHGTSWRLGLYLGLSFPVLVSTFFMLSDKAFLARVPHYPIILQIYAGFSLPILFTLLFAVNLFVWSRASINYRFVFEFDPRDNLEYHQFAEFGGIMVLLWSYSLYLTFAESDYAIGSWLPLILFGIILLLLFFPLPVFYLSSRKWFLRTIGRIVAAPYHHVEFRDFFIADELNSLVYSIAMLQYFVCAYSFGFDRVDDECDISHSWLTPVLAMLPAYWRFVQCLRRFSDTGLMFPHMVNAGKYSCTILVVWLNGTQNISQSPSARLMWIISAVVAACYTYSWDVLMDWGLFQSNSKNLFLRNELIYEWKWCYYWAIVSDFFLRLAWIFTISDGPWSANISRPVLLYSLALLEMLRRFQWNFFRLENEHLNNCGEFRAVKEIPLPFQITGHSSPAIRAVNGGLSVGVDIETGLDDEDEDEDEHDVNLRAPHQTEYVRREYETKEHHRSKSAKSSKVSPSQPAGRHVRHKTDVTKKSDVSGSVHVSPVVSSRSESLRNEPLQSLSTVSISERQLLKSSLKIATIDKLNKGSVK